MYLYQSAHTREGASGSQEDIHLYLVPLLPFLKTRSLTGELVWQPSSLRDPLVSVPHSTGIVSITWPYLDFLINYLFI